MWSDNETELDLLGFRVHADLIRALVTDPDMLPITVGIFGDWGSGKTSIMRMLQHDLDPHGDGELRGEGHAQLEEGVAVLYFNGWQFEGYDDAKAAILSSMLTQLMEHKRFGPRIRQGAKKLLKSVSWMRVAGEIGKHVLVPALTAYFTGGASAATQCATWVGSLLGNEKKSAEDEEQDDDKDEIDWEGMVKADPGLAAPLAVRSFRKQFGKLLKESHITSLVVLVDDLDRCTPDTLIANLEAIKLFLSVQGTAFVIGADPRIVEHAIRSRYRTADVAAQAGGGEAPDRLVQDYLEKLVQVPYRLPRLSPAEVETYMALLFCHKQLSATAFEKVTSACEAQRAEDRYSVFGAAKVSACLTAEELGEELSEQLSLCNGAAPLITEGLKGNPRQVKRFLNALWLRKRLAQVAKLEHIRDRELVKLMVLEYADRERFEELFLWQSTQDGFPVQLKQLEGWAEPTRSDTPVETPTDLAIWTNSSRLKRWLASERRLSEVDLRDYFWIARDRLQATFSEQLLIPPDVQRLLAELFESDLGRKSAVAAAAGLGREKRQVLLDAIKRRAVREPDNAAAHDALRELAEMGVEGATEVWASAILESQPERIPASTARSIASLAAKLDSGTGPLTAAVQRLRDRGSAQARKSIEAATKPGKG